MLYDFFFNCQDYNHYITISLQELLGALVLFLIFIHPFYEGMFFEDNTNKNVMTNSIKSPNNLWNDNYSFQNIRDFSLYFV